MAGPSVPVYGKNTARTRELRPVDAGLLVPAGRWVSIGYLVCALLVAAADLLYVFLHYTKFPFGDQWVWLGILVYRGPWASLSTQLNEHRVVIPALFYILDHRFFGGTNTLLVIVSSLIHIGCIVLLTLPLWLLPDVPKSVRYVFTGFVTITMLWYIQAENFFYPFSLCLACANLGILGAVHLFSRLQAPHITPRLRTGLLAGVVACSLWATFSYGHGLFLWPVLLVMALLLRFPARSLLLPLAMAFAAALALYFFHFKKPPQNPLEALRHPIQVLQYLAVLIGLPFFGGGKDVGFVSRIGCYVVSISGILLAIAMLLHYAIVRTVRKDRHQTIYCSLILLTLGTALVTSVNRSHFGIDQALSGRYAPVPLLFWISLVALITVELSRWEVRGGMGRAIWCALLIMASVSTLSTQPMMGNYMAYREREQAAAAMSLTVGVPDAPRIRTELASTVEYISFVDRLSTHIIGHSFFSGDAQILGTPLLSQFKPAPSGTCKGFVDLLTPLAPAPGARLYGWAWDSSRGRDASRILVVDDQNVIRGLGVTHLPRPDVAAALHDSGMASTGWTAYSKLPDRTPGTVTVYADLGNGSVCRIGEPRTAAP